jgi:uncharacterized protein YbaP (TraB family)
MKCVARAERVRHTDVVEYRPLELAAVICVLAATSAAVPVGAATCRGTDLFPLMQAQAPEAFSAIEATGRALPFAQGKLFRLAKGTSAPSYLLGTLHLADPRVTDFSPRVRDTLAASKVVALEAIEDGTHLRESMAKDRDELKAALLAPEDRRANRLLDPRDFAALEALLERRGFRRSAASQYKASVLALILDLPSCAIRTDQARPYADELVGIIAHERKIPVVGLETLAEQLTILDGLPREVERDLLLATLHQQGHAEDVVETTIARYEAGDIGLLLALMRAPEPVPGMGLVQTPPAFLDRLIDARTLRMRDRALPLLAKGAAFVAVGAAHLAGEDGLLRQLENEGYTIELVE